MKVTVMYALPDWAYKILKEWDYDFEMNAWDQAMNIATLLRNGTEKKEDE